MAEPTDAEVSAALAARGVPRHVIEAGAQGLISRWRTFVNQVEAGYPLGLEEYRNDLDLRTLIGVTGLAHRVRHEDARLQAALTSRETEIWSSDAPDPWWTHGYPAHPGPLLLEDLRAEGII